MEKLLVIVPRTLLGLLFLSAAIDGLSYVLRGHEVFRAPLSAAGQAFLHNLKTHALLWGTKATVDLIAALMLLVNFHAPLALLLLLPSTVVIVVFQFSINKVGIPVGILLIVLMLAVGGHYVGLYAPLLQIEDGSGPLASGPYGRPAGPMP